MSADVLDVQLIQLLQAIYRSKNQILPTKAAEDLVGAQTLSLLRQRMDEQKLLMPASRQNKGGFELTAAGMKALFEATVPEVLAAGEELNEINLYKAVLGGDLGPEEPEGPTPWSAEDPYAIYAPAGSGSAVFLLPDDRDLFVELTWAIPADWSWINGELRAPPDLVEAGRASEHAGFILDRHRLEPVSERDRRGRGPYARVLTREEYEPMIAEVRDDLLDLAARHRLPGFVHFRESGFDASYSELDFATCLQVAVAHLTWGYQGWLSCFSDCHDNRPHGPEEVVLHLEPWTENDMGIRTLRPAVVEILWKPRHGGGKREHVQHLIELCESRGLEEVTHVKLR